MTKYKHARARLFGLALSQRAHIVESTLNLCWI